VNPLDADPDGRRLLRSIAPHMPLWRLEGDEVRRLVEHHRSLDRQALAPAPDPAPDPDPDPIPAPAPAPAPAPDPDPEQPPATTRPPADTPTPPARPRPASVPVEAIIASADAGALADGLERAAASGAALVPLDMEEEN